MFEPFEARGKSADFIAFPAVRDELPYRLRQQSLLGAFGRSALQTRDLKQILQRAIELCAEGLESPFAKVLEYIPEDNRLLMRAGFGWELGPIDNDIRNALEDASSRVAAIAQVHDQLWRGSRIGFIDLADFMNQLCKQLGNNTDGHVLNCHADTMLVSADHVIPLGLLINELVMNAVKYAYPDGVGGIDVSAHEIDGCLHVEISDHGVGLPQGFDIDKPRTSLGFKVITGLVRQLQGRIAITSNEPSGARFLLELPILSETLSIDPVLRQPSHVQPAPLCEFETQ